MKRKPFWIIEKGKVRIVHSKLIKFLNDSGFAKAEISSMHYVLVKETNNTVVEIGDHKIVEFIQNYLKSEDELQVLEAFTTGVSGYVSNSKLRLLKTVVLINDRDSLNCSWFYFKNICCKVEADCITRLMYEDIVDKIWESRILKNDCFFLPFKKNHSFIKFCWNISGRKRERFKALQSIIGYLLHRYQDPGNARAVILTDQNITFDGSANGGTGKSLLLMAIGKCRELVVMDGKHIKENSWFKNQRIERTTDIVFYDDVRRDFSLESLYSMITTGITVERKYKPEEYISPQNAPKICVSSNYVVSGTGGSTEVRRRCDFEFAHYYDENYKPEDEFGKLFFDEWDEEEWSDFYHFMMKCVQVYLKNGLIIPDPINLNKNKLISETSVEFVQFIEAQNLKLKLWYEKRKVYNEFIKEFPEQSMISMNQFTRWFKIFYRIEGFKYSDRKAGDKYQFRLDEIAVINRNNRDEEE